MSSKQAALFLQPGHCFSEIVKHEEIITSVDEYVFIELQVRGDGIDDKSDSVCIWNIQLFELIGSVIGNGFIDNKFPFSEIDKALPAPVFSHFLHDLSHEFKGRSLPVGAD